ncbi:hypothetical protein DVA67_015385 [Solirubrobacter sp. CPCC 204708]|uniref:TetR family transcriptional regulator n=1 Tax=Solirubrobacter deserti TaxID=2282478 RepID=A0ABT4RKX6_9ACTN|nr:hypothetical protein [Solirubrobacter deserti]MBE2317364.1 hypothetical protein [Solirubrobacter deserti]MDA0139093.1 hypothetical protein [Solirubrobacter deserti]
MDSTRERIVESALAVVDQMTFGELLAALTPERLAEDARWSPGTVRYQFRAAEGSLSFDRGRLADALLDRFCERSRLEAQASVAGYVAAAEQLGAGDLDSVAAAIESNMAAFRPGSAGTEATAGERVHLLALAMCDAEPAVAARLRGLQQDVLDIFAPVYDALLAATGRRPAPGFTPRELAVVVNAFLEGLLLVHRYDTSLDPAVAARAVLRAFWALTVPDEP